MCPLLWWFKRLFITKLKKTFAAKTQNTLQHVEWSFVFFNELNKLYYLKERPTNVPHIQKYTMDGYKT